MYSAKLLSSHLSIRYIILNIFVKQGRPPGRPRTLSCINLHFCISCVSNHASNLWPENYCLRCEWTKQSWPFRNPGNGFCKESLKISIFARAVQSWNVERFANMALFKMRSYETAKFVTWKIILTIQLLLHSHQ